MVRPRRLTLRRAVPRLAAISAILLASLIAAPTVCAHALSGQCKLRGNQVELEAYFDDDSPAADAKVRVLDKEKQPIRAGRTDAKGRWSFPRPAAGKYLVIVDAGAGHRADIPVTIEATA